MTALAELMKRLGLLQADIEYNVLRASVIIIFIWFGFDKWHASEIEALAPLIRHGPLIFWTLPLLGVRGTAIFLGTFEWTTASLLFLGFWNKKFGMAGAIGSIATFVGTLTILPFVPDGWDAAAGGFPAMAMNAAFLLKDLVLLAVSLYLMIQDARRIVPAINQS